MTASPIGFARRDLRGILLLGLVALVALGFALLIPNFLSPSGLLNLLRQWSVLLIVALGATFVIVAGEIDLSVGAVVALVSILVAWATRLDAGIALLLVLTLGLGLAVGALNAFVSLWLGVPSFLATLGIMLVIRGAAMTISLQPMAVRDFGLISLFRAAPLGLPMPFVVAAVLAALAWVGLHRLSFGAHCRAVGSSAEGARLAGIPVRRVKAQALILGAAFAALGGFVLAGRTNYGMAASGTGLELDVIAAVVLGGGRLGGGRGSVGGTVLGTLLLTLIFTGIAVLGLSGPWQDVVKGAIIGAAILLMRR